MGRVFPAVFTAAAALIPTFAAPVVAQERLPKFYVYGEDDTPAVIGLCRVTHAAAITEVKSELRTAGVTMQENSTDPEAVMDAYINISAMTIGGESKFCTYNIEFNLESFGNVTNPFTGTSEFTKLAYCSKGSLMVWDKAGAQAAVNERLRGYVRECLTKYKGRNAAR